MPVPLVVAPVADPVPVVREQAQCLSLVITKWASKIEVFTTVRRAAAPARCLGFHAERWLVRYSRSALLDSEIYCVKDSIIELGLQIQKCVTDSIIALTWRRSAPRPPHGCGDAIIVELQSIRQHLFTVQF